MAKAHKTDNNQREIVEVLRACGFSVSVTSSAGDGFPDLVAGKHGVNYLIEVKRLGGKLTPRQIKWHDGWRGQVVVAYSVDDLQDILQIDDYS
jgi:Holliday junction resolvase